VAVGGSHPRLGFGVPRGHPQVQGGLRATPLFFFFFFFSFYIKNIFYFIKLLFEGIFVFKQNLRFKNRIFRPI
jgi:hypothetical protein